MSPGPQLDDMVYVSSDHDEQRRCHDTKRTRHA